MKSEELVLVQGRIVTVLPRKSLIAFDGRPVHRWITDQYISNPTPTSMQLPLWLAVNLGVPYEEV